MVVYADRPMREFLYLQAYPFAFNYGGDTFLVVTSRLFQSLNQMVYPVLSGLLQTELAVFIEYITQRSSCNFSKRTNYYSSIDLCVSQRFSL